MRTARSGSESHVAHALDDEVPLSSKIPLGARLRVGGNDRQEKGALSNLLLDLRVPDITASQLTLVKPHLHSEATQRIGDATRRVGVFTRVAQKNRTGCGGDGHGLGEQEFLRPRAPVREEKSGAGAMGQLTSILLTWIIHLRVGGRLQRGSRVARAFRP
jgi:hypothetical protein